MTILLVALAFFAGAATAAWICHDEDCDDCTYRDARIEDLENELRVRSRAHHPAGRGIGADVIALREALEDRDAGTEPGA